MLRVYGALEERKQPRTLFTFVFWWDVLNCKEGIKQKHKKNNSILTTLNRNWVKVNNFVPWRQCLRFHPQQTHFHSGCSFEVIQVLAVSDGRDGLSTNSIYSIMWQSKKHFFPLLLQSPQSSADIAPLPSSLTGFCTFAHWFVSVAPSTLLLSFFFWLHLFPPWLLSLFFIHAALPSSDSFGSSPQSCLFS